MNQCCREVQVLRTFAPPATRHRATRRLLTKYADGRRAAASVVDGLAALLAQLQYEEASAMLNDALLCVRPVPSLLWDFACRQLGWLRREALCQMLALADRDPRRLGRRFEPHRAGLIDSVDGILALLQEGHRFRWAPALLRAAMRGRFGLRSPELDRGLEPDRGTGLSPVPEH